MIVPVILCGGEGKRLWPLSRADRPKPFLALAGDETLLQQTVRRLADPALFARPIIVGAAAQRFLIGEQLLEAGLTAGQVVLEPVGRNSAPALALGALLALRSGPDATILSVHADAAIPDAAAFRAAVAAAAPAAAAGRLVLFGVRPTEPSSAYGYIEPGAPVDAVTFAVSRFIEKPAAPAAETLIAAGCLWNTGIFLMRAALLVAELETYEPAVVAAVRASLDRAHADDDFLRLDAEAFAGAPSISIDHAVMERTALAAVAPVSFAWSDVGAWSAVWDVQPRDRSDNAVWGQVVLDDVTGSLVFAENVRVAAHGVSDLIVVATPERVLVMPRGADHKVRDLAARSDED
ncbi:MAG TPA: sugar phosphate nucleotidyltransferase [Caulobacteraceae bacterium]|jgi:mannose-1-phosphate guanylyltransferase/mannose-1-phosphate guanylyltransferase/mannose-6-phosphate isomerase